LLVAQVAGWLGAWSEPAHADTVQAPCVVLVYGDACAKAGAGIAYIAQAAQDHAKRSLAAASVPYRTSTDTEVVTRGVGPQKVAIFPYNTVFADGEAERLTAWVSAGGRAIFVHALPEAASRLIGVTRPRPFEVKTPGEYHKMVLPSGPIVGLPSEVAVAPQWVNSLDLTEGVQRLGFFSTRAGRAQSLASAYLTARGAYLPCLLTKAPARDAGALLRALAGHFDPGLWDAVVPESVDRLGPVEGAGTLGALLSYLSQQSPGAPHVTRALRSAGEAEQARARARKLLSDGLALAAADLARAARTEANRAYWMAWPSRAEELRGVWASNDVTPSWAAAAEALARARINVVFPYMASAAAAYYPSSVLPPADGVSRGDDDLAEAVKACHARGVKVHVRLLGLSCLFATSHTRATLAQAGRLMVDPQGNTGRWLCPSNPQNRRQVVAAAVEMVTRYPVDGFQLDYFRYPGRDVCTCPCCRAGFEALLGRSTNDWPRCVTGPAKDLFLQFRRRQLDSLLAEVRQAVLKARPGLPFSGAVFLNWPSHRDTFGQDWVPWLRDGLIDFACPMDYTADSAKFEEWAGKQRAWVGQGRLCLGIGPYADGVGDFPPLTLARQIATARKYGEGWVLFNLRGELLEDHIPRLELGLCYTPPSLPAWAGGRR